MLVEFCLILISIIIPSEALFLFSICETMSRRRSIYDLCDLFFFFTLIIINQIISLKQTHLFLCKYFLEYALLFLEIKRKQKKEKKGNNFQEAKVQPRGVAQFLLDFFANFSLVLLIKKACTAYPKCWKRHYQLIFQIINTVIYNTFPTVLCVHGTALKVFLKLINVNLVRKLKRSFTCS